MIDKSLILNKIKKHKNFKTNKDFAEFLGVKTTTLSMWHKRNTMDIELLFNKCEYIDANWLLTGEGEMLKQEQPKQEVSNIDYKE
ncbi:helix-turn-helix domain-containing protein, partial [Tenacibaculum piscium]